VMGAGRAPGAVPRHHGRSGRRAAKRSAAPALSSRTGEARS
jgi:hypothetical protein